jgi:epsilon-lactone hydrolase
MTANWFYQDVTLEVWSDMIGAWHLFYQQVAAGRHALAAMGALIPLDAGLRTQQR